ncbi:GerAB/ArcD/ProY family transporter [Paenibacillus sp. JJ-223]|uniref:GerAB/ArcD/ProY family transporter n=1 Tax=Paenibacillus sp. JJ-223 TaxID=2905647 RepID=UPI001F2315CD|nr:GerAB/ArcD/ProY family transporter [Paenibacillus sp. JJ-223]CAH1205046.1 Spore germination protein YndE [Paenibacillus sp. JJ-223]
MSAGLPQSNQLTTLQAMSVIVCFIIGAELLILPRELAEAVGTPDAWMTVAVGGTCSFVNAWIIIKLSQRFPEMTFYEYVQEIAGSFVGKCIGLILILYYINVASYELRSMEEVTSFFLLEGTPGWAILALFIWTSLYLCMEGITTIGKVCQVIFPIIAFVLILIFSLGFHIFDVDNLRPVLAKGFMPVLHGMGSTTLTFSGSECLLFILCRMQNPKRATLIAGWGIGLAVVFYTTAVIICIGAFSIDGVLTRTWPFFDLARSVEVENLLLERFESLLLSIWIIQIFATFTIVFYCAALGLSQITKMPYKWSLYVIVPFICVLSQLPQNMNEVFAVGAFIGKANLILFSCFPIILLLLSVWRSKLS